MKQFSEKVEQVDWREKIRVLASGGGGLSLLQQHFTITQKSKYNTLTIIMSASCETCGWLAAAGSALAFGTFGVPIKSDAAKSVDVDPLVFQSYKTFMCFITSWLVLLFNNKFEFTPWGIVSGLFWVPGGVATVYAIKAAGLAIGIGIGSSFIVLVSFVWGIFVFQEKVQSKFGACFAIVCMMAGLMGMSYFSSPAASEQQQQTSDAMMIHEHSSDIDDASFLQRERGPIASSEMIQRRQTRRGDANGGGGAGVEYQEVGSLEVAPDDNFNDDDRVGVDATTVATVQQLNPKLKATERTVQSFYTDSADEDDEIDEMEDLSSHSIASVDGLHQVAAHFPQNETVAIGPFKLSKRHAGMLSAAFTGCWGGSILAPMKWCRSDTKGTGYLLSFSIGASIITISLWLIRFLWNAYHLQSFSEAYYGLPSFHLQVMWRPGGLGGLLWSLGNFFSLISVFYLGEGVGYPLSQTSILIAGLWGIFFFHEVTGTERIGKWILSALLTIFGILLLSYEHHAGAPV